METDSAENLSRCAADLYRADRHQESLELCLSLADLPDTPPWVLSMIGTMYYRGRGTRLDPEEGLRWYKRAAEAGDPGALTFLSSLAQDAGRHADARVLLEDAAARGYPRALIQLGYIYDRGLGVSRDPTRARQYFEEAAAKGYIFAKRLIAGQLLRGDDGLRAVPKGALMFLSALIETVAILTKDRYSDRAKR